MDEQRCARRMACYTAAMAATLAAPVVLQAALVLRPDALAAPHDALALSLALSGSVVVFPALVRAWLDDGARAIVHRRRRRN